MIEYPRNDDQYHEEIVSNVAEHNGRYTITVDGWSLYCGDECSAKPEKGQTARMYGYGIGSVVRGLFIGGIKYWYRTDAEEKEFREVQCYGKDAKDWLARWDEGKGCWSIEMGGLGPGYEQAIQITVAEAVRWFIANNIDHTQWEDDEKRTKDSDRLYKEIHDNKVVRDLGLSGAQYGAAVNLASIIYSKGPRHMMRVSDKKRHIQISKFFPKAA